MTTVDSLMAARFIRSVRLRSLRCYSDSGEYTCQVPTPRGDEQAMAMTYWGYNTVYGWRAFRADFM